MLSSLVAALPLCVVIVSGGENGNVKEKLIHEQAHCWGWVHPERTSTFGRSYTPPAKYARPYPNIEIRRYSTPKARAECRRLIGWASMACMDGGLFPK